MLNPNHSQKIDSKIPKKSFPQTFNQNSNVCQIPTYQLPQPCYKGDHLAISIPENEYLVGIDVCKHNIHGREIWPKGSSLLTVVVSRNKLTQLWNKLGLLGITSLGKGFYELSFSSLEDAKREMSNVGWNLSSRTQELFPWTKDFNPNLQKSTTS